MSTDDLDLNRRFARLVVDTALQSKNHALQETLSKEIAALLDSRLSRMQAMQEDLLQLSQQVMKLNGAMVQVATEVKTLQKTIAPAQAQSREPSFGLERNRISDGNSWPSDFQVSETGVFGQPVAAAATPEVLSAPDAAMLMNRLEAIAAQLKVLLENQGAKHAPAAVKANKKSDRDAYKEPDEEAYRKDAEQPTVHPQASVQAYPGISSAIAGWAGRAWRHISSGENSFVYSGAALVALVAVALLVLAARLSWHGAADDPPKPSAASAASAVTTGSLAASVASTAIDAGAGPTHNVKVKPLAEPATMAQGNTDAGHKTAFISKYLEDLISILQNEALPGTPAAQRLKEVGIQNWGAFPADLEKLTQLLQKNRKSIQDNLAAGYLMQAMVIKDDSKADIKLTGKVDKPLEDKFKKIKCVPEPVTEKSQLAKLVAAIEVCAMAK